MSPRAVIFDFFGTLTRSATGTHRTSGHELVAGALGVPVADYTAAMLQSWPERATGRLGDLTATLRWIASACGVDVDDERLAEACRVRRESQRSYVELRDEAEPTLRALKERGYGVGLVSDCTHELPEQWPSLPIAEHVDAPVFSVAAGIKKPDPAIYHLCCERLGVAPADCVYVGDGDSFELTGAQSVGMSAYRLVAPDHDAAYQINPVSWSGPQVTSLSGVLDLV